MLNTHSRVGRLALLAIGLGLLAGCGNAAENNQADPAPEASSPATDAELASSMPLAGFLEEQQSLATAVDQNLRQRMAACMAEAGFTVESDLLPSSGFVAPNVASFRYGLTDPVAAQSLGYHSGPGGDGESSDAESDQPGYMEALFGDGSITTKSISGIDGVEQLIATVGGGCTGEATLAVFGSADNYFAFRELFNLMEDVANRSWTDMQDAPEFHALNSDWTACMAGRGVMKYASPLEPLQEVWDVGGVTATETTIAVADVGCKNEVDYVTRASAIEGALQESLLASRPTLIEDFVEVRAALEAQLSN